MAKHSPLTFEYSKITPQIFIGTNQCCQMHFAESLLKKGLRADISLEQKRLDTPFGVDYYLWLPVKDHQPPTPKQMEIGVEFIDKLVKLGEKIYVHCEHGHGRAPTLVAAYLASRQNMSITEALAFIKKRRPRSHPNRRQINAIIKYTNQRKGRGLKKKKI